MTALRAQLAQLATSAAADRPTAEWDAVFRHKVVRPVLFLGQTLVYLPTPAGENTPTALKMLIADGAGGIADPIALHLAECLNHFMQTILLGIPGKPGHPPQ